MPDELDLNLLAAFDQLAQTCSVTRAAAEMGVTQSAMSHTLARLRSLLGDPLLVRSGRTMMLTPRAETLAVQVRGALVALRRAVNEPQRFDPWLSRRLFTIAANDVFDLVMAPLLFEHLQKVAPGVQLALVRPEEGRVHRELETGDVDMLFTVLPNRPALEGVVAEIDDAGLASRTLYHDRGFLCAVRKGHPALRATDKRPRLTVSRYARLPHLLASPRGRGPGMVDKALAEHGLKRTVAMRVPGFAAAFETLVRSDLILTAPALVVQVAAQRFPIITFPVPLSLPDYAVQLIWHERFTADPAHRWLRDIIAKLARY